MSKLHLAKHHNLSEKRGGTNAGYNTILFSAREHPAWHKLFGVMTVEEAIEYLKSVADELRQRRNNNFNNQPVFFRKAYARRFSKRNRQTIRFY